MNSQGTHVICDCCESRVKFASYGCPECGYNAWPSNIQEAIEHESCELDSWIQDAVGDMAGHDEETVRMNIGYGREGLREKVKQAIKDGVVDVPGWLADYFYNDVDTLHDLTGDRIHDSATTIMARMDAKKEVERRSPPYSTRLQIMIAIAKDMAEGAHPALRIALDDHIGDWQNQLKTRTRKQREAEAAAYGDSQIHPKDLKVCSQCASPTNRPVTLHGQVLCQACSTKL